MQGSVQSELVGIQPVFKEELLGAVEQFTADLGDFDNDYDKVNINKNTHSQRHTKHKEATALWTICRGIAFIYSCLLGYDLFRLVPWSPAFTRKRPAIDSTSSRFDRLNFVEMFL